MELYALFEEVSDQYGTSELVAIYDTKEQAFENASITRRNFVHIITLNGKPTDIPKYVRRNEE